MHPVFHKGSTGTALCDFFFFLSFMFSFKIEFDQVKSEQSGKL